MELSKLIRSKGRKRPRRVGRGHAAGQGKTCGRGQKGQKARGSVSRGFEGGQTPLYKRLPKLRGQSNKAHNIGMFRAEHSILNVSQLERFEAGSEVTPDSVLTEGLVSKMGKKGLKILGEGDLSKALAVKAHAFSASAIEKIEKAGGSVEVIEG